MSANPFRYFKTSPKIIRLAVMLYIRFPLSLRNVEDLLHERGIDVSHETVRYWWNRFGPIFAAEIRRKRARHLQAWPDEMFVRINDGEIHYLWRAVDQEGEVLEAYVTKSRQPREFATEPIWMLDGFNEGWVAFQDGGSRAVKGRTNALAVIAALVTSTERR